MKPKTNIRTFVSIQSELSNIRTGTAKISWSLQPHIKVDNGIRRIPKQFMNFSSYNQKWLKNPMKRSKHLIATNVQNVFNVL